MRRRTFGLFAVSTIALWLAAVAFAQVTPVPPPTPAVLGVLERLQALLDAVLNSAAVGSVAFVIAMLGRVLPFIPNKLVPGIALVANLLGTAALVMKKLTEATTGVTYVEDMDVIHYAGFLGSLRSIGMACGNFALSLVMLKIQRALHEDGLKQVSPAHQD